MTEKWKDIPGYEGLYQASTHGRIRSLDRVITYAKNRKRTNPGRVLSPHPNTSSESKHLGVKLYKDGKQKGHQVHRLILITWKGPCPPGMQCCHEDGNAQNNKLSNLRWGTRQENEQDRIKHRGKGCVAVCRSDGHFYQSIAEAARENNTSDGVIRRALDKGTLAKGYKWYLVYKQTTPQSQSKAVQRSDGEVYKTLTEAGLKNGVNRASICRACKGILKTVNGYTWSFCKA